MQACESTAVPTRSSFNPTLTVIQSTREIMSSRIFLVCTLCLSFANASRTKEEWWEIIEIRDEDFNALKSFSTRYVVAVYVSDRIN